MLKASKFHPLVTIFLPTGSRAKDLATVLQSLSKQTFKNFNIIIVDYKSGPETFKVIDKYKKSLEIILIHQKEKGLSKAANLALKQTKGSYFIRTDDDVQMSKDWLKAIVQTFEKNPLVGGVTGPTIIPDGHKANRDLFLLSNNSNNLSLIWKLIHKLHFELFLENKPFRVSHWCDSGAFSIGSNYLTAKKEPIQEVTNLEACNYAVRTELLQSVGGFDSIYAGVGEYHEADAAFKIKKLGYKLIFNPKALLYHLPSQDGFFNDRPESYSRMVNFIVFYLRHIKPNTFRKFCLFFLYILFQDGYYIYKAVTTLQTNQLGALAGSVAGFGKYLTTK